MPQQWYDKNRETDLQKSARIACGNAASRYGENSSEQWDDVARWAGFDNWKDLEMFAAYDQTPMRRFIQTPRAHRKELAAAAVERMMIWLLNTRQRNRCKLKNVHEAHAASLIKIEEIEELRVEAKKMRRLMIPQSVLRVGRLIDDLIFSYEKLHDQIDQCEHSRGLTTTDIIG